jgi:arsenate reductase
MAELTVYEKPTCTTCRKLSALLTERGVDFEKVDYHVTGLDEATLRDVLGKAGLTPHDVVRPKEARAAGLDASAFGEDELYALLAERPELLQRPLVVRGDRALLARPPERVLELF